MQWKIFGKGNRREITVRFHVPLVNELKRSDEARVIDEEVSYGADPLG